MRTFALVFLIACDGGSSTDAGMDASVGAVARYAPGAAPMAFGDVPFPSDLYLVDGHPSVGALPVRDPSDPRFTALRELLGLRRGFCGTCNLYFAIDGALDPASIPASAAPGDAASASDAIVLFDLTDETFIPLRVEHQPWRDMIAVRPVRGIVLHRGHRYAAALSTDIRAADGSPLASSPAFDRAGAEIAGAIDAMGIEPERVAVLSVFTVGDPTIDLRDVRSLVHAAPAPVAVVDRVWTGAEIDALLGIPAEDRPGIDVPPAVGQEGTAAMRHATVGTVITGRFQAPRVVEGEGTDIGAPRFTDGRVTAGPQQDVPFLLIVPSGATFPIPVLVHHHGFNANRTTGFVFADSTAGAAILSIDGFQHGARAHTQTDTMHNMRGELEGADGFPETDVLEVSARVFGLEGGAEGMELYPGYALGAFLQFAGDVMAAIRFAREGDLGAIAAVLPGLAFDPDRIAYAGNSMGSVVGVSVLSAESDAGAYVLNVQPGSMVDSLAEAAEFRMLTENVFLPVLGITGDFDEIERAVVFEPVIDLFRWALEPVDPLALAPYLFRDPVAGGTRPDVLFQLASLDQLAAPPGVQSMLSAAGVPGIGVFDVAPIEAVSAPVSANLGGSTVAAYRYDPAAHGMLEIVEQPSAYELPLVPPLVPRPAAITVQNPIVEVHAQIEAFLRTRHETGRAEIR